MSDWYLSDKSNVNKNMVNYSKIITKSIKNPLITSRIAKYHQQHPEKK